MLNKKIIFLAIFIIFLLISAVSANDNSTADIGSAEDIVDVNSNQGNFTELSNLIDSTAINETLTLDKDYQYDSNFPDGGIGITKSITVDGMGHTIDGASSSRIFKIYSDIVLKDIVFMNANASSPGGALYFENSNAQIINCTFRFNQAKDMGGAFYSYSSNINVSDCTFANNTCGGLYSEGGAIYASSSKVTIANSKFYDNSADAGGAINVLNTILNLKTNDFVNNVAKWYGGGIFSDSSLTVNSSTFRNNKAGMKGGAIHSCYGIFENCRLNISYSSFINNSAEYGGAVSSSNLYNFDVFNSKFCYNHATYGAVIARLSSSVISMVDTECYNNVGVNGSVIYAPSSASIYLTRSDFVNNTGDYGCLIYTVQGRFDSKESQCDISIDDCSVLDNEVKDSLIFDFFGNLLLNNSRFIYKNTQYQVFVIKKLANGSVNYENNLWGVDDPDFSRLIYVNNTVQHYNSNESSQISDGDCASVIIQIDENHTVSGFRRDSTTQIPIFINGNTEVRHEKFDTTYFAHMLVAGNGWVFGNGGLDSPYQYEKIEAIAKTMIENNDITSEYMDFIYKIKTSWDNWGHFIIKAPDGRYGMVDYYDEEFHNKEMGVLKSGEYFLCPNSCYFHKKGNVSDLNQSSYLDAAIYLLGTDLYGKFRTTIQTFVYSKEVMDNMLITRVDAYASNDDGKLTNLSTAQYVNDIFSGEKYIIGHNLPKIMDREHVGSFILDIVELPPIKTQITVSELKTTYNKGKYLTATLKDVNGNVIKNARLSISLNGKVYNRLTDSNGQVKLFINLVPKTYAAKITFEGNNKYDKASSNVKIVVKKAKVKLVAKKKTFKKSKKIKKYSVTLKNNLGKALKKVTLKLKIKGKTYGAKTNSKGKATFKIKKLTKKGTFKAKISFKGNKYYYSLTKTVKIKVK